VRLIKSLFGIIICLSFFILVLPLNTNLYTSQPTAVLAPLVGESEITLVLTGDIMLGRGVGNKIDEYNDPYFPFEEIGKYTKEGDITFGNLETTISNRGEPLEKKYVFRAKPRSLQGMKDAGFDIVTLANNHICDYGPEATLDTMDYVEQYGMDHVGLWYLNENAKNTRIQRPLIIERNGLSFAFLGYGENLSSSSLATLDKPAPVPAQLSIMKVDIQYARSIADIVVVSIHWTRIPQYVKSADQGQISLCHSLCDWGADIITNHGPHVLQEIEYYNNSIIFYSLGNTVFDLSNEASHYSMIVNLHLEGKNLSKIDLVPIVKNDQHQYEMKGSIVTLDVNEDLYLNWDDYESLLFENVDSDNKQCELKVITGLSVSIAIIGVIIIVVSFKHRKNKK